MSRNSVVAAAAYCSYGSAIAQDVQYGLQEPAIVA